MHKTLVKSALLCTVAITALAGSGVLARAADLSKITNIVVIYAENRSFDNLYGHFPGANGLDKVSADEARQLDRDGTSFPTLPHVWKSVTAEGVIPAVKQLADLPNGFFAIDSTPFNLPISVATRDLVHRFYQEQMQIDGGKNDKFAAWSDAGGLVMGTYDGSKLPMWKIAQKYVLADNFFHGAFGGSFLNHIFLVCACAPIYPDADKNKNLTKEAFAELKAGVTLTQAPDSPESAYGEHGGPPAFVNEKASLTPLKDGPPFYAVNTMMPPYQPSAIKPAEGGDPALADPSNAATLPPQTMVNIGDLLSQKGVSWSWYSGAWQAALNGDKSKPVPNFQYHHQPFNYFASTAPGTPARSEHLKDGGLGGTAFLADIDGGKLPSVTFYKPQGNLNEHAGYAEIASGDEHIADVVAHLEKSPQWPGMVVIVTYDENGGFWDHVAPPKADRWGPGTRIPTIIVSPFAKMGTVDHTEYDTTSILRLITARYGLPVLDGIAARDAALKANGQPPLGDLTAALNLGG
jgi:acid phosphatase